MKRFTFMLVIAVLICLCAACAEGTSEDGHIPDLSWFELSGEDTVLTVRLPGNNKDGMDWEFEISNPEALELLTQEEIEGESEGMAGSPTTYIGSFMSTASAENTVTLMLRYGTDDPNEAPFAIRTLELNVTVDNKISVKSVCERNQSADWLEYDMDNFILTLRLPDPGNGSQQWDMFIQKPEFLELITCETEKGYVGSFMSNLEGTGFTELQIRNENISYTVNLFASEAGDIFVEWTEVCAVLIPEAYAE